MGSWAWAAVVWFCAIGTRLRMRVLVVFWFAYGWWLLVCFDVMGVGCLVVCWFWANFGLLGWLGVALIGFCL